MRNSDEREIRAWACTVLAQICRRHIAYGIHSVVGILVGG